MLRAHSLVQKYKYSPFTTTCSNLSLFTRSRPSSTSASASAGAISIASASASASANRGLLVLKGETKTGTGSVTATATATATARESTATESSAPASNFKFTASPASRERLGLGATTPALRISYRHSESKLNFDHASSRRTGKTPRPIAYPDAGTTSPGPLLTAAYNNPEHAASSTFPAPDCILESEPTPSMVRRGKKIAKQLNGPASKRGKEAKKKLLERIAREEKVQQLSEEKEESESAIPEQVQERAAKLKFGHEALARMAEEQRAERRRVVDRLRGEIREGIAMEQEQDVRYQEEAHEDGYPSQSTQMNARQQSYPVQNSSYGDMASTQYAQQLHHDSNYQFAGFGRPSYPNMPFPFMAMPGYWNQFNPQAQMFQPRLSHPSPFGQSQFPPARENPPFLEPSRPSLRPHAPVSIPVRQKSTSARSGPPAPKLAKEYLTQASHPPTLSPTPQPLLIILDLNGTLIFRKKRKLPAVFARRPGLDAFLSYLFSNFKTMIWTSSQPETVASVVYQLFPHGEHKQLVDVWARDTLGLTKAQYREKVQVYKPLNKVWKSKLVQSSYPQSPEKPPTAKNGRWNQTNTILIDDSALKAIANPHNIIEIPEFTNDPSIDEQKNLHTVMRQLRILSHHEDVSQKLREWAQLRKQGAATVSPAAVDEFWDAQLKIEEEKLEALLGRKLDALGGVDDDDDDADVKFVSLNRDRDRDRDASPTERAVDEAQQKLDRELHISSSPELTNEGVNQQHKKTQGGLVRVVATGSDGTRRAVNNNKRRKARRKENKKAKARARVAGDQSKDGKENRFDAAAATAA